MNRGHEKVDARVVRLLEEGVLCVLSPETIDDEVKGLLEDIENVEYGHEIIEESDTSVQTS